MSAAEILERIRQLPPAEQQELVNRILEEFGGGEAALTPEAIAELDRRAEDALAHPERCRPLEVVLADLEERFRAPR